MAETYEIENIRTFVSAHVTKILMLYGRLNPDYNPRYLPVTVSSALVLINELEHLEKKYYGLAEILVENLERREKYSNVFNIPESVRLDPTINGLRSATYKLAGPLISNYCIEDRRFLSNLGTDMPQNIKHILFSRAKNNCEFLSVFSRPKDAYIINDLKNWCETILANA